MPTYQKTYQKKQRIPKLVKLYRRQQHLKTQVPILQHPPTSSLSQVSDSINTKSSLVMVSICPRCYCQQLESCAAQLCNALACVLGGVVLVLWVVVLVGLVCASLVSVRVPHFPGCRCCIYLELSVMIVLPNLFLLLTQWLCYQKPYSLGKSDGLLLE